MKAVTRISFDKVFTSYQELLDALATLGDPAPGHKRVFRGQTKGHGKMLPTGLRGKPNRSRALWGTYCLMVATDIRRTSGTLELETDQEMLRFGIQAISQHYGPGSEFLDVTHSIDVALWFALHVAHEVRGRELIAQRFSNWPCDAYEYEFERPTWIKYSLWKLSHGLLYIFDVPEWTSTDVYSIPKHGELLDLLKPTSPEVLKRSQRIQVQQACLVMADPKINGGDLSDFFACDPIQVKWPMEGALGLSRHTEEMFPLPGDDPWYGQFLSIPFVDHVDLESKRIKTDRSLPVAVYSPDDVWKLGDITRCFSTVRPTLEAYSGLETSLPKLYEADFRWLSSDGGEGLIPQLNEATKILLEGPVIETSTPVSMGFLNHEALLSEISETVTAFDLETSGQLSSVSLNNVFVEFSPLEHVGWQRVVQTWGQRKELPSSLWLVRHKFRFFLLFLYQAWPKTNLRIGPRLLYEFEPQQRRFYLCFPEEGKKGEATGRAWSDQAFFAVLNVLRGLSPTRKVKLAGMFRRRDGNWNLAIRIRNGEWVRLMRPVNPPRDWYVLRDLENNEPYMELTGIIPITWPPSHQPRTVDPKTKIEIEPLFDIVFRSKLSWSELDLPSIRRHSGVRAAFMYRLRRVARSLVQTMVERWLRDDPLEAHIT